VAVNPNFTFADPLLQREVVNAQQVQAAAEAARAQQFAETPRALRQERQAAADREERRAIREGDIRRQEAQQAENRRQFDESLRYNREALASQENVNKTRLAEADEKELYNNLLNIVEKGDDVPTLSELEVRMAGLSPARKQALRERRQTRFDSMLRDFNIISDEAARVNKLIGSKDPKTGLTLTADDALSRSQHKRLLSIGPDGLIGPLLRRPREDATAQGAATPPFHVPIGRPGSDITTPGMESIVDIERRSRGGNPGFAFSLGALRSATPVTAPQMGQHVLPNGARVFVPPSASYPPSMLGNQGVLAPLDYSGPEYDYSQPRFAMPQESYAPEDVLAPPVFAPAY
jgi:hypothetical protein